MMMMAKKKIPLLYFPKSLSLFDQDEIWVFRERNKIRVYNEKDEG